MWFTNLQFWLLVLSTISIIFMMLYVKRRNKKDQINSAFLCLLICVFIISFGVILQSIGYYYLYINPFCFEYIIYIGTCFLPVAFFFTGLIFANTKIKFKKSYLLLFIIPIISLIVIWTNNYHHLFYKNYSLDLDKNVYGPYFNIYSIYNLSLYALGLLYLLRYSVKNSGFFSKQAILFTVAILIPLITNILGSLGIVSMSVYITPISFTITILLMAFAIFKFKFLKVTPIALQKIVDRMSDSFIVLNEENVITDFNKTFIDTFELDASKIRNSSFEDFFARNSYIKPYTEKFLSAIEEASKTDETILLAKEAKIADKYFNIEINRIMSNNSYLGTLILLKDVTQHINDLKTIEANQDLLIEKERLASLGQMIGGIAHNLKTPIMSIAGAAEGLTDLTKEYDISIGDSTVTNEDHHEIVKDMNTWIEKIKTHISYMSDVITAVKGQAVAFSEKPSDTFTINELLKYIDVLMRHELKNALIDLNINLEVPNNLVIKGNINSLVQVINNMISNAIQAYNGTTNKSIDFIISKDANYITFSIKDYGCGISKEVQDKLFKEMVTTKGKNGTGLGLFMSYSNIRAHFNGNIIFESEEGKGTTFHIVIPIQ